MSDRKFAAAVRALFREIWKLASRITKGFFTWLLRTMMILGRRPANQQGFVLPTITLVGLVVILVVVGITARSFDRARTANNVRVNESVLRASAPAIDRVKAKLDALFSDPTLPRGTPSDLSLFNAFTNRLANYTFGDETPLKLVFDIDRDGVIKSMNTSVSGRQLTGATATITNEETLNSAWRFPIDTDGNGLFDTFTLYSIQFRVPSRNATGQFDRPRSPLDARTPPMENPSLGGACAAAAGGGAAVAAVGGSDWYPAGSTLQKSFFSYIASVPIRPADLQAGGSLANLSAAERAQYEPFQGQAGMAALEFQQDRSRVPINNNAVWSDDDIHLAQVPEIRINGRIHTNGNLNIGNTIAQLRSGVITQSMVGFYQVSSDTSCFYTQENSLITVGGHVMNAAIINRDGAEPSNQFNQVHRFQGRNVDPQISSISTTNRSVNTTGGRSISSNSNAYNQRLTALITAALNLHDNAVSPSSPPAPIVPVTPTVTTLRSNQATNRYPEEVIANFSSVIGSASNTLGPRQVLYNELQTYFQLRVRRVPFAEVGTGDGTASNSALGSYQTDPRVPANFVLGPSTVVPFRPPNEWMALIRSGGTALLPLNTTTSGSSQILFPRQTRRDLQLNAGDPREFNLGDRILVGHHLPFYWAQYNVATPPDGWDNFTGFAAQDAEQPVQTTGTPAQTVAWNNVGSGTGDNGAAIAGSERTRQSRINILPDLGSTERGGFWEAQAARIPDPGEASGGLRIVTGAGIYVDGHRQSSPGSAPFFPRRNATGDALINSFLPEPTLSVGLSTNAQPPQYSTDENIVVWPDTMPMTPGTQFVTDAGTTASVTPSPTLKGDLLMRATAVYHYAAAGTSTSTSGIDIFRAPMACVSSYYDPSTPEAARNGRYTPASGAPIDLPDVSGGFDMNTSDSDGTISMLADGDTPGSRDFNLARSNNGVVFNPPYTTSAGRQSALADANTRARLDRQARLVFPNGRIVNEPLRQALQRLGSGTTNYGNLLIQDISAIDTALCSLGILNGSLTIPATPPFPHGAIKEATFLNAREVLAVNSNPSFVKATSNPAQPTPATDNPAWNYSSNDFRDPYGDTADPRNSDVGIDRYVRDFTNSSIFEDRTVTPSAITASIRTLFDLPLESRQPLEVRVTDLDMNLLRRQSVRAATAGTAGTINDDEEFMLPNSGIIFITRDDALPDASFCDPSVSSPTCFNTDANVQALQSSTDLRTDPTRRPNGVRLINGANLARKNFFRTAEKGLIVVTNLPAYVKAELLPDASTLQGISAGTGATVLNASTDAGLGGFNLHKDPNATTLNDTSLREEYSGAANLIANDTNWSNFYNRPQTSLNPSFACRQNQPGCTSPGDQWRPATIISDAQTLLSANFLDGFRNEGDYDLNDNTGINAAATPTGQTTIPNTTPRSNYLGRWLNNGFWRNNFVASYPWNRNRQRGSNIERRDYLFPLTNVRPFLPGGVATPTPATKQYFRTSYLNNGVTPVQRRVGFNEYLMEVCPILPVSECGPNDWYVNPATNLRASQVIGARLSAYNPVSNPTGYIHAAGTTAQPAAPEWQRFARRVAFLRDTNNNLILESAAEGAAVYQADCDTLATGGVISNSDNWKRAMMICKPIPIGISGVTDLNGNGNLDDSEMVFSIASNQNQERFQYGDGNTTDNANNGLAVSAPGTRSFDIPRSAADYDDSDVNRGDNPPVIATTGTIRPFPYVNTIQVNIGGTNRRFGPIGYDGDEFGTGNSNSRPRIVYQALWFRTAQAPDSPQRLATPTASPTRTATATATRTATATATASATATATTSATRTLTATATRTISATATLSITPTVTVSRTATLSATATRTASATATISATRTATASATATATRTATLSATATATRTATATATATATRTSTPETGGDLPPIFRRRSDQIAYAGPSGGICDGTPVRSTAGVAQSSMGLRARVFRAITGITPTPVMAEACSPTSTPPAQADVAPTPIVTPAGISEQRSLWNGRFNSRSITSNYGNTTTNAGIDFYNEASWGRRTVRPLYIHRLPVQPSGAYDPTGQPLLIPILNIQNPHGDANRWGGVVSFSTSETAASAQPRVQGAGFFGSLVLGDLVEDGSNAAETVATLNPNETWLQLASPAVYNLVVVAGNSPSTSGTDGLTTQDRNFADNKFSGGLHNFPRFLENWSGRATLINGSLIQSKPSSLATGSWQGIDRSQRATAFYDVSNNLPDYVNDNFGDDPDYPSTANPNYIYRGAASRNIASYYMPPDRYWGYDVGLLSQSPDLFAQRFTVPPNTRPPEFFREISRNDLWIQNLLCAATRVNPASGAAFQYAVDASQRGSSCRALDDYREE